MLGWIDGPGDRDGDGLLDYRQRAPRGLRNQGWKDSDEGVLDELGTPPGAADRARRAAGVRAAGQAPAGTPVRARRRRGARAAAARRGRVRCATGWTASGSPSAATTRWASARTAGRARRSPPTRATCCGRSRCRQERAQAVRDALMSDAMFSGWGHPDARGGRGGLQPGRLPPRHRLAARHRDDRLRAAQVRLRRRLRADLRGAARGGVERRGLPAPELFAGFSRTEFETPVPYPVACQPQAWAAGAIPYLVTAGLGLVPDALERRLRVRRPSLPGWLRRVEVRGLRVADARVDLLFERAGVGRAGGAHRRRIDGDVEVVLEISGSRAPRGRALLTPVPVVLERPARADRPGLHAVGDRDRLELARRGHRVELGRQPEPVERGQHAGADALGLGRRGRRRGARPSRASSRTARPPPRW